MDLFGIGPLNILLILAVMLIVFGPERLPEMAAKAGKLVRDLRSYASDVTTEFSGEFAEFQQHFNGIQEEMQGLGRDLQQHSADVGATLRDVSAAIPSAPASAVSGVNDPPPATTNSGKVVPLTKAPTRARVDDYKPGS